MGKFMAGVLSLLLMTPTAGVQGELAGGGDDSEVGVTTGIEMNTKSMGLMTTLATPNIAIGSKTSTPYAYKYGSGYWVTSSIREWLNSNEDEVGYTNAQPDMATIGSHAYSEEKGFLKNFTQDEVDGIAVTERRTFVNPALGSNSWDAGTGTVPRYDGLVSTPYFHVAAPNIDKNWKSMAYQAVNEKVFLLAPHELIEYVQKRGNTYKKTGVLTYYATSTYNYSNANGETIWYINASGGQGQHTPTGEVGIAPAIHLKPDYLVNGKPAGDLQQGEKVTFGSYRGQGIVWEVINKTPEGYPLLWSEKVIDKKRYAVPSDVIYRNSESVNFPTADISIKDDLKFTNGTEDTAEPTIRVVNEDSLNERQNGSFFIKMEATDAGSGVDYIILPNGEKHYGSEVEYEITDNGRFNFEAVDKSGNHYGIEVPVGNINLPADVVVDISNNGWTNKDVVVNIRTSQANTDYSFPSIVNSGSSPVLPNYTTYSGKKFRFTGAVRVITAGEDNYSAIARMIYLRNIKSGNVYYVGNSYPGAVTIPIKNLSKTEFTEFDTVFTLPGDYFGNLYTSLSTTSPGINSAKYKLEWKNVKVELLDREDFGIDKIILPSGEEIHEDNYTDTLKMDGVYTYKVVDSRGKVTERTVEVKIDKVKPTLTVTGNPVEVSKDNAVLKAVASDALSGVKRLQLPNGEWVSGSKADYTITENGSYTFVAEDNAGNTQSNTVVVKNIDREPPTLTFTSTPDGWTNKDVIVDVHAEDNVSGVKIVALVNEKGTPGVVKVVKDSQGRVTQVVVSENGDYLFTTSDTLGNTTTKTLKVRNITKEKPSVTVTASTTEITHEDVLITVEANEGVSGIKRIKRPDGVWIEGSKLVYPAQYNGVYEFVIEDNAGNLETKTIEITNIDKEIRNSVGVIEGNQVIEIEKQEKSIGFTFNEPVTVSDWRDTTNDWRLVVSASRLTVKEPIGGFKAGTGKFSLPSGTISIKPFETITRLAGAGVVPQKGIKTKTPIDSGKVEMASTKNSRGDFEMVLPTDAVEMVIDPTVIKTDKENYPGGVTPYETTITWEVVSAP